MWKDKSWLPMSTAPKDGTVILGYNPASGIFLMKYMAPAEFFSGEDMSALSKDEMNAEAWVYSDFSGIWIFDGGESTTHWLPLPPEPQK